MTINELARGVVEVCRIEFVAMGGAEMGVAVMGERVEVRVVVMDGTKVAVIEERVAVMCEIEEGLAAMYGIEGVAAT